MVTNVVKSFSYYRDIWGVYDYERTGVNFKMEYFASDSWRRAGFRVVDIW